MIYEELAPHEALSQGDLFDECPILFWETSPAGVEAPLQPATVRVRVVVLTQILPRLTCASDCRCRTALEPIPDAVAPEERTL